MARKPTGNPRGRYTDPANENVACSYGCGKTGRKGPMVTHERHYCAKRPGQEERDARTREERSRAPPAPALVPRAQAAKVAQVRITRERIDLVPWDPPVGA